MVKVVGSSGAVEHSFFAYENGYRGGVNVARGCDGGRRRRHHHARQRGRSDVKVFDGATYQQVDSFFAFDPAYRGGVEVAFGHFGSGTGDIVVGMARGRSLVKVFDGQTLTETSSFSAFGPGTRGVNIAVGNLDNDPHSEIVTAAGTGGSALVKGFDPTTGQMHYQFLAGSARDRGGVELTTGDFDGNYVTDVATAVRGASALW